MRLGHSTTRTYPIQRSAHKKLHEMVGNSTIILYSHSEISMLEFETKTFLKVTWIDSFMKETQLEVLVPRECTCSELVAILSQKQEITIPNPRVYLVSSQHKIERILQLGAIVTHVNLEYSRIIVEVILG